MNLLQQLGIRAVVGNLPGLLVSELAAVGHITLELDATRVAEVVGLNLDDRAIASLHMTRGTAGWSPYVAIIVKFDLSRVTYSVG